MQAGLDVMDDVIAIIESLLVLKVVDAVIPAAPNTTQHNASPAPPRLAPNWSSQTGAGACVLCEWADAAKQQRGEERQRCLSLT